MKETKCTVCGKAFAAENLTEFDGHRLCQSCLDGETITCIHCGGRIWSENNAGDEITPLCSHCYDNFYTFCEHCDRIIRTNEAFYVDDDPFCHECYAQFCDRRPIHDYYFKPDPIFYGDGNRYFGVELEVDEAGECDSSAEAVMDIANFDGQTRIYCKHDGSLDDGFELVSHPASLDFHLLEMPWQEMLDKLKDMHYRSHQAGTCGLHVHVNRDSLGDNVIEQEACIARILYFFEKHWEELLKFSRRTERQLNRWAARYGFHEQPLEILDRAKAGTCNGRYMCVNLGNSSTIEFRIFRGTLKHNTLIATLQLVNRIAEICFTMSDEEIQNMSWTTFVSMCTEPELIQYLKERRIYINEPVSCEEEM